MKNNPDHIGFMKRFNEKYKEDYAKIIKKERDEVKVIAKYIQILMPHINWSEIFCKVNINKYNYTTSWIRAVSRHLNSDRDKRWIKDCYESIRIHKNRPIEDFGDYNISNHLFREMFECLLN